MDIDEVNRKSLFEFMQINMTTLNFQGHTQTFLPKRAFVTITRRSVIEKFVSTDEELSLGPEERTAFVTKVYGKGPKLFLTCVYCGLPMTCLEQLLSSGISDKDIPLTDEHQPSKWSWTHQLTFTTSFLVNQKRFNAPHFSLNSFQDLDDSFPIPINFDEKEPNLRGKGSFGMVWEIGIHEDHHNFNCEKSNNHRFAMKVIQHEASQVRERKFTEDTKDLEHDHLVKCFASWKFAAKYYMIYELATSNLEEFIQKHEHPSKHPELTNAWFTKQLCGLAGALRVIHNQESKDNMLAKDNMLGVPNPVRSKSGYIHDIKPENILVFVYNGNIHCFRLSDFGCAKVVDFIASISGQHNMSHTTVSKSGTPDYRPPEAQAGETSRPYDLWSLGCVYLELLVWFLQGYEALKAFRVARRGLIYPGGWEDEAFYSTDKRGAARNAKIRKAVLDKMEKLEKICPADLGFLLRVVPFLLRIEPKDRLDAAGLVQELKHLDTSTPFEFDRGMMQMLNVPVSRPSASFPSDDSDSDTNQFVIVHKPADER